MQNVAAARIRSTRGAMASATSVRVITTERTMPVETSRPRTSTLSSSSTQALPMAHLTLSAVADVDDELEVAGAKPPDCLVEIPSPDGNRGVGDETAEGQHPDLGRAGAHVDDHRGHRLLDPQPGAERDRDLLLHETDVPRPRLLERPVERPPLDACRAPGRAAQHRRVAGERDLAPAQQLAWPPPR